MGVVSWAFYRLEPLDKGESVRIVVVLAVLPVYGFESSYRKFLEGNRSQFSKTGIEEYRLSLFSK